MADPLFTPEVRLMLEEQDAAGLRAFCEDLHPATMAAVLDGFPPEQIWDVLSHADVRNQAAIFEYLPHPLQLEMLAQDRPQVGALVGKMSHDDRVDVMRRAPAVLREKLLATLDEADRKDVAALVEFGADTVGAIMTTDYAWLRPDLTTEQAIDQLRTQAGDRETIYYIYVLDEPPGGRPDARKRARKLLGVVSLRDLILAPKDTPIRDLVRDEVVTLRYDEPTEKAAQILARYDFIAMPVTDAEGRMLGIVTHDDVIDVIQEEATEDLQRQAGVGRIEGNYLEARFWLVWLSRVQVLALVFLIQMFTINVMAWNEEKIRAFAALVACLPLVMSVGGNAGSQAATLVVRSLSLEQIRPYEWRRVLGREVLMGLALAGTLGLLALFRTYFLTPSSLIPSDDILVKLTIVLGTAVVAVCLCGTLLGAMLPLVIHRLGGDPALVSSPAIATFSDVAAIVIYANIALLFFGG
jgi:magnesium transporter